MFIIIPTILSSGVILITLHSLLKLTSPSPLDMYPITKSSHYVFRFRVDRKFLSVQNINSYIFLTFDQKSALENRFLAVVAAVIVYLLNSNNNSLLDKKNYR